MTVQEIKELAAPIIIGFIALCYVVCGFLWVVEFEFSPKYIEEIIDTKNLMTAKGEHYKTVLTIKRTYSSGKSKIITKTQNY